MAPLACDIRRDPPRLMPDVCRAWPQLSSSFERKLRQFGDTGRDPPAPSSLLARRDVFCAAKPRWPVWEARMVEVVSIITGLSQAKVW